MRCGIYLREKRMDKVLMGFLLQDKHELVPKFVNSLNRKQTLDQTVRVFLVLNLRKRIKDPAIRYYFEFETQGL